MKLKLLLFSQMFTCVLFAQNTTYYINFNLGNDANTGTSNTLAWKTINRANAQNLQSGDKILLFSDGPWHSGSFYFDANDIASPANPIEIASYGSNPRAVVYSDGAQGLYSVVGSLKIKNLEFYANRMYGGSNDKNGIFFYADGSLNYRPYINIDNCKLEGYGDHGIIIYSLNEDASRSKGFSDITIKNTTVNNCGKSGIIIGASGALAYAYVHNNVLIENVRTSNNAGVLTNLSHNTGNGIVVSSATNVLIQNCIANGNGANNRHVGGGPAAIWIYDVKFGIIQKCEAYGNFAGLEHDGNGFGIDGGCQDSIIQYCYSHDNEGAGFGLFEFGSLNEHLNNTIRYNISQNDGKKNQNGGLLLWGVDAANKLNNADVYNNTIYLDTNNLVNNSYLPTGVKVLGNNMNNVRIMNNIFYLDSANPDLSFVNAVNTDGTPLDVAPLRVLMLNNLYYKASNPKFNWGVTYNSLSSWNTATNQEKYMGSNYGFIADPNLTSPGNGLTIANNITGSSPQNLPLGIDLTTVTQYKLQNGSFAIGGGLNLNSLFGINIGSFDYFNQNIASLNSFDIGANQHDPPLGLNNYFSNPTQIFPNYFNDYLEVNLLWKIPENVDLFIFNNLGNLMISKKVKLNEGLNSFTIKNLDQLNSGIYFLNIIGTKQKLTFKIIKK